MTMFMKPFTIMPEIERDEGMYMNKFLQERKIAHGEYDFTYISQKLIICHLILRERR